MTTTATDIERQVCKGGSGTWCSRMRIVRERGKGGRREEGAGGEDEVRAHHCNCEQSLERVGQSH